MEGFTTVEVAKLTGVNRKTLHYWDKSGFLSPSLVEAHGTGTRRIWGFRELVAAKVARELRASGISLQSLRHVAEYLRKRDGMDQPLSEVYLITDGTDVYEASGREVLASVLRRPGQMRLFHVVDLSTTVEELRAAVKGLAA